MLENNILTLILLTIPELLIMSFISLIINKVKFEYRRLLIPVLLVSLLGLLPSGSDPVIQTLFSSTLLFITILTVHYVNEHDSTMVKSVIKGFVASVIIILSVQTFVLAVYHLIGVNILAEGQMYYVVRMPILVIYLMIAYGVGRYYG